MKTMPAIILVAPQLPENIGMVARAMGNMGFTDLILVAPRDGASVALGSKAIAAASGADSIIQHARVFDSFYEAIAPFVHLCATTARHRDLPLEPLYPALAMTSLRTFLVTHHQTPDATAFIFGCERSGLSNEHISFCHTLMTVETYGLTSLNLAQSVLLFCHAFRESAHADHHPLPSAPTDLATTADINALFSYLFDSLETTPFFQNITMRPIMMRHIRQLFLRKTLTAQEVRTLFGIFKALARHPLASHGMPKDML